MRNYPKDSLPGKALSFLRAIRAMQIRLYAANAGFFVVLSIFPALVLILSLLRYTPLRVDTLAAVLEGIIPEALLPAAHRLIVSTYANTSGAVVGLSALVALWSAGRGIHGLLVGLNAVYGVKEDRGYLRTRLISAMYTFAFLLVLLLTLVLHVFGTSIVQMLPPAATPLARFFTEVIDLRFFLLLGVQTLLFCAMYTVFPNQENRFCDSLPGALLASSGWLIFSDLFSIYVEHFASYTNIYGSVYAVALSMLWLYFCLSILFYGGALNRFLTQTPEK